MFDLYYVHVHYFRDEGNGQLSNGKTVSVAPAKGRKTIEFLLISSIVKPSPPDYDPLSGETLISVEVAPIVPIPKSYNVSFAISGKYTYSLDEPPTKNHGYSVGTPPWSPNKDRVLFNFWDRDSIR